MFTAVLVLGLMYLLGVFAFAVFVSCVVWAVVVLGSFVFNGIRGKELD